MDNLTPFLVYLTEQLGIDVISPQLTVNCSGLKSAGQCPSLLAMVVFLVVIVLWLVKKAPTTYPSTQQISPAAFTVSHQIDLSCIASIKEQLVEGTIKPNMTGTSCHTSTSFIALIFRALAQPAKGNGRERTEPTTNIFDSRNHQGRGGRFHRIIEIKVQNYEGGLRG